MYTIRARRKRWSKTSCAETNNCDGTALIIHYRVTNPGFGYCVVLAGTCKVDSQQWPRPLSTIKEGKGGKRLPFNAAFAHY